MTWSYRSLTVQAFACPLASTRRAPHLPRPDPRPGFSTRRSPILDPAPPPGRAHVQGPGHRRQPIAQSHLERALADSEITELVSHFELEIVVAHWSGFLCRDLRNWVLSHGCPPDVDAFGRAQMTASVAPLAVIGTEIADRPGAGREGDPVIVLLSVQQRRAQPDLKSGCRTCPTQSSRPSSEYAAAP